MKVACEARAYTAPTPASAKIKEGTPAFRADAQSRSSDARGIRETEDSRRGSLLPRRQHTGQSTRHSAMSRNRASVARESRS